MGRGRRSRRRQRPRPPKSFSASHSGEELPPECPDRISGLPTFILVDHILSRLPLKAAVRCSILSKPWLAASQELLSHATVLDLGEAFAAGMSGEQYSTAVDRILAAHKAPTLHTLKICHPLPTGSLFRYHASEWVELAVAKHVNNLEMEMDMGNAWFGFCEIPGPAFYSESLTRLSLKSCSLNLPFDPFEFPSLEELSLNRVTITKAVVAALNDGFPNLAVLELVECIFYATLKISAPPHLRSLTLISPWPVPGAEAFEIEAPSLVSLRLSVGADRIPMLKNVEGLKDACIDLPHKEPIRESVWTMLSALTVVAVLTFYGPPFEHPIPTSMADLCFINLKSFRYHVNCSHSNMRDQYLSGLIHFLHWCNFPSLEKIIVEERNIQTSWCPRPEYLVLPTPVPPLTKLKEVTFIGFSSCLPTMKTLEFLLKSSSPLDLNIIYRRGPYCIARLELNQLLDDLEALPEESESVEGRLLL